MTNQGDINNIRNGKILDTMANKYDFDKTMIQNLEKGNISKAMCEAITTPLFNINQQIDYDDVLDQFIYTVKKKVEHQDLNSSFSNFSESEDKFAEKSMMNINYASDSDTETRSNPAFMDRAQSSHVLTKYNLKFNFNYLG